MNGRKAVRAAMRARRRTNQLHGTSARLIDAMIISVSHRCVTSDTATKPSTIIAGITSGRRMESFLKANVGSVLTMSKPVAKARAAIDHCGNFHAVQSANSCIAGIITVAAPAGVGMPVK